jgi:hypothetical protein
VIGGERELVAAAGRVAVDGADVDLLRILRRVLDGEARLVGELAEVHLGAVRRLAEHADVGAGAEHIVLARLYDHAADFGMLETQPLHGIVELDVDAEVVGIELELVVAEPARLVDIHDEVGDVAVALDLPVAIVRGVGLVIDYVHRDHSPSVRPRESGDPAWIPACAGMNGEFSTVHLSWPGSRPRRRKQAHLEQYFWVRAFAGTNGGRATPANALLCISFIMPGGPAATGPCVTRFQGPFQARSKRRFLGLLLGNIMHVRWGT